jgi:hypothetical protein
MLQRKETDSKAQALPADWCQKVADLLNETYHEECEKRGWHFDIFGQFFPEELLVIACFNPTENLAQAPISIFLSCDKEDIILPEMVQKTQAAFIDIFGLIFDEIFSDPEWNGWEPQWQEVSWKNKIYFHKITRENIHLTLEADRLLGDREDENI